MKNNYIAFVAMLLAGALLFTACAGNSPANGTKNTNETERVVTKPTHTPEELQAYYDNYFGSEEMRMAGTAVQTSIRSGNSTINVIVSDGNFEVFVGEYGLGMYMKDGYMYLHVVVQGEEGGVEDEWYRTTADEQKFYAMTNEIGVLPSDFDINAFTDIKYLATELVRDCWTDVVKVTMSLPVDSFEDEQDSEEDRDAAESVSETTEEEYVFYVDSTTHTITCIATSNEGTKLNENNEIVTEVTVVECWFGNPVEPRIPAGVAFEDLTEDAFEETFGFALLAVLLMSLA